MEIAESVAVEDGEAEALGDAGGLGCVRANEPDHFDGGAAAKRDDAGAGAGCASGFGHGEVLFWFRQSGSVRVVPALPSGAVAPRQAGMRAASRSGHRQASKVRLRTSGSQTAGPCAGRGRALPSRAVCGRLRLGLEADRRGRRPQQARGEDRQGRGRVGDAGKVRPGLRHICARTCGRDAAVYAPAWVRYAAVPCHFPGRHSAGLRHSSLRCGRSGSSQACRDSGAHRARSVSIAVSCRASLRDSASISGWRSAVIAARFER